MDNDGSPRMHGELQKQGIELSKNTVPSKEGFTYLCTVQDLCSRRIVGWATSRNIDTILALDALNPAIALRKPWVGLIVHSDRRSQFASLACQNRLSACEFLRSVNRNGNYLKSAVVGAIRRSLTSPWRTTNR